MSATRRVAELAFATGMVASSGAIAQEVTVTPPPVPAEGAPPPAGTTSAPPPAEAAAPAVAKPSGWDPEDGGFHLRSPDGQYRLRFGLQAAYKIEPVWIEGDNKTRSSFAFLRPIMEGSLFRKWIRFWTSLDLNSNPPYVLDSYVEVQPVDAAGVRAGQFWTPISRHEQYGPQQLLFAEWSLVADYFWPGRDKGVMAFGTPFDSKFEYYAGVFSGSPLRTNKSIPGNWEVMARFAFNPLGPAGGSNEFPYIVKPGAAPAPFRWSLAVQGWTGKVQSGVENFNPSTFRFDFAPSGEITKTLAGGVDMFIQGSHFSFLAEGYMRRIEYEGSPRFTGIGGFGQLGVMIIPHFMDIAGRVNWLDPSMDLSNDRFWSLEAQTAFYISSSQHLVLKARYGYGHQESPGADQGKVPLPVGSTGPIHLATLQMNVMF